MSLITRKSSAINDTPKYEVEVTQGQINNVVNQIFILLFCD